MTRNPFIPPDATHVDPATVEVRQTTGRFLCVTESGGRPYRVYLFPVSKALCFVISPTDADYTAGYFIEAPDWQYLDPH